MVAAWDRRPRTEQARVEGLVLGSWLPQAVAYAPHWSALADRLGVAPQDLRDRDDLRRLPASRLDEVADAGGPGGPGLVLRPTASQVAARSERSLVWRVARSVRSDGAAGQRRTLLEEFKPVHLHRAGPRGELAVASTRSDLDRMHRVGARAARVLGLDDTDYLVSALPPGPRADWWGVYHLALGRSLLALHPRVGSDLDGIGDAFGLVPATAVAVPRDEAIALADLLRAEGVELARVRLLVTVGSPPSLEDRAEIAEAWRSAGADSDLLVRALFGPEEGRVQWAECAEGTTGLHTSPDLELLEVLDPITAEPSAADGELALTTAGWHGTALLRYRTGVWVEQLETDPCPACGRTVPRLAGEVVPQAWQPGMTVGDRVVPLDLRAVAFELGTTPGVQTWRVELQPPAVVGGADRLWVELAGDVADEDRRRLAERVERSCGVRPAAVEVSTDPDAVERGAAEVGSVFADLR